MNGTFVESRNISCYITVDFAKEEGYIVIEQLVSVHCSFLYFELSPLGGHSFSVSIYHY